VEHLNEGMLRKMVERSAEKVETAFVEKKSLKSERRKEIVKLLEDMGLKVVLL
jgi:D-tyrosyl-tRNA(Tyr) deacylase